MKGSGSAKTKQRSPSKAPRGRGPHEYPRTETTTSKTLQSIIIEIHTWDKDMEHILAIYTKIKFSVALRY